MTDTLPNKMSDLLEIAINDARKLEALPGFKLELAEQVDDGYDYNTDQEGTGLAPWEAYEKAITQLREIGL